jgi:hypothetical protein
MACVIGYWRKRKRPYRSPSSSGKRYGAAARARSSGASERSSPSPPARGATREGPDFLEFLRESAAAAAFLRGAVALDAGDESRLRREEEDEDEEVDGDSIEAEIAAGVDRCSEALALRLCAFCFRYAAVGVDAWAAVSPFMTASRIRKGGCESSRMLQEVELDCKC